MFGLLFLAFTALIAFDLIVDPFGPDTSLYVRNETDKPVFIRGLRVTTDPISVFVMKVGPGVDGLAVAWRGDRDAPVVVLDAECQVLGEFRETAPGIWTVDGVPGLSARVEADGARGQRYVEGVELSRECGGTILT